MIDVELPWLDDVVRAKYQRRVPFVLSRHEVAGVMVFFLPGEPRGCGKNVSLCTCLVIRVLVKGLCCTLYSNDYVIYAF